MLSHSLVRVPAVRVWAGAILLVTLTVPETGAQNGPDNGPAQQPPSPISAPRPGGIANEPAFIGMVIDRATEQFGDGTGRPSNGWYPEFSNMVTGSGWVSVGPGYRHSFSNGKAFVDGSAAVSWHLYRMAQGRVEFPRLANGHLAVGAQGMWQDETQVDYFGVGPGAIEDDRSQYWMRMHDVVGYAKLTTTDWLAIAGEVGWLGRPDVMAPGGTFRDEHPDVRVAFPSDPAVSLDQQPVFLHSETAITADTRDHRGHPTGGALYRAAMTSYYDRSGGTFSFSQYEAEGLQFIPLAGKTWILALRGWALFSDVPIGHQIPFYLLPSLGGDTTLRDYPTNQFHDQNLLVANAECRVAIFEHIDLAGFFDAGNVANRFSNLNLDKTSYGAGLRLHNENTTFGRIDVAYGELGWRFVLRTNDPLRLSRIRRQIAAIPFMP
jgi:hypothetical protein